jgi:thiamine biosynthesis lipoprotein
VEGRVEAPEPGGRKVASVVPLFNRAMATSGNYRQFQPADDGELLSHVIDPRSDYPVVKKASSVTVIAESCAVADAWATALFVIGPGKVAEKLAEENGLEVMWDGGR